MGQVGNALTTNLLKHGYNVTTVLDTNVQLCEIFPQCTIAKNPKEVAVPNDVILTGLPKPANVKPCLREKMVSWKAYQRVKFGLTIPQRIT